MKDLKDIILDIRIRNLEIEGKQVPDKYISVFNSYLEQIAESLADYTKQVRKEVCEEIKKILLKQRQEIHKQIEDNSTDISYWTGHLDRLDIFEFEILDQIQD